MHEYLDINFTELNECVQGGRLLIEN